MFRTNIGERESGSFYPDMENLYFNNRDSRQYGYVLGVAVLLLRKFT